MVKCEGLLTRTESTKNLQELNDNIKKIVAISFCYLLFPSLSASTKFHLCFPETETNHRRCMEDLVTLCISPCILGSATRAQRLCLLHILHPKDWTLEHPWAQGAFRFAWFLCI